MPCVYSVEYVYEESSYIIQVRVIFVFFTIYLLFTIIDFVLIHSYKYIHAESFGCKRPEKYCKPT